MKCVEFIICVCNGDSGSSNTFTTLPSNQEQSSMSLICCPNLFSAAIVAHFSNFGWHLAALSALLNADNDAF